MSIALRLFVRLSLVSCLVSAVPYDAAAQPSTATGGGAFTLVVKSDGTLWAFGLNNNGQIGDNTLTTRKSPQQVSGLSSIQTVAAGSVHAMALTASGSLYVWGDNLYGQVGDASTTDRKTPVLLSLSNVTAIAAGEFHSLALTSSGNLYAWGRNNFGQIGNGNTTNISTPTLVLSDVVAIGAGRNHSLAVKSDGSAWAWGANGSGQLGTNTTSAGATSTPVQMLSVSGASQIVGGEAHSFIVLNDGTLKGVGENGAGQLADGTPTDRWTAITIGALSNVAQVASGLDHAFARLTDGSVFGWGENTGGELGLDANTTDQKSPVEITALNGISAIAAGWSHSIAVDASGVVSTWGANASSQLGDGTTTPRSVPTPISESSYAWRVATPVFSVASGTYSVDKTVTTTVDTVGATIHYTQNGADPTESDPTGTISVTSSQTVKARAWKTGMPASEVAVATYTLQVATPTVSPTATTYTSPQNVTMSTTTPGSTLRYTIDGTDPTESSTAYAGAINVAHTTTFRIAGFKNGWSTSTVRVSTYTMNFGTLAAPTVDPATGSHIGSVSVTMSSPQSGATIRYTTNNTAPTASSAIYTSALAISTTTTIRAKAFHPDYTASAETSRTYTLTTHTPIFDTADGSYAPGSRVTITAGQSATDTLRMTVDGNDPTTTSPIIASGTAIFLGNFTLKVKAWRTGATESAIASAAYTLTAPMGAGSAAAGGTHSLIATPDGRVIAWGENLNGEIGNESTIDRTTPTVLNTITGVTQIAGGLAHTLARTWDGQLYAWGSNGSGRLGDGTLTQRTRPTPITTLSNVVAVAAGDAHSLALTSDGDVYAWGLNSSGELGLGNTTATSTPTLIPTLSNVIAIAAGDAHSLAVTSSGQLYAWGNNGSSRLGNGNTTNQTSPVLINLADVVSVAAGAAHSIALTASGAVYSWGAGSNGQLGRGNTSGATTPTVIPSLYASAIAAGDNFSGAIRSDGVLVAWGLGSSGQIGDTFLTQRTAPVVVSGPASISNLAYGDAFSIVVTPTGEVWTWGAGSSGQLGDGGISNRATPQAVLAGLSSWMPAAPTVSAPSQTFTTPQTITLTSSSVGAVIRYNLTGADPIATDAEVPLNGEVLIEYSSLLRARAFADGRFAGAITRADYQLQSAAPTIDPPTGLYTSGQTVTLSVTGPPSVIRYTLDGGDPSAASTPYSAPFSVTSLTTIKARAFPANGWGASATTSATLSFNYGPLDPPTPSPAAGLFATPPQVTLTSIAGASIRYTLNGSTPTASSTLYAGPITIPTAGATLKSIALHPDWTTSAVRSEVYTVDTTAPTITAQFMPAQLNTWNRSAVTVSFYCADNVQLASCSPPATFDQEGAGQTVIGTAVDSVGNQAQLPVTVNLDFLPPTVTLTAPNNGLVTSNATLAITGEVADAVSGLAAVTCNGVAATVVGGALSCDVTLRPGRNVVVVAARDVAGNSASSGVTVTLVGTTTQLTLSPTQRTMLVGESLALSLRDNYGVAPTGATWQTTNAQIVSLSTDDPPVLTAVAEGSVNIVASKPGLQAVAQITVVAGDSSGNLPSGTTRWKLTTPMSSQSMRTAPIYTHRVEADGPDLFTVEPNFTTGEYTVRAATLDGGVLWKEAAPGLPLMGDSYGALVAGVEQGAYRCALVFGEDTFCFTALTRFGGGETALPWRYDSAGMLDRPAQGPDGTIYAIEHIGGARWPNNTDHWMADYGNNKSVVILDGSTGQVVKRVPLPAETSQTPCGFSEFEPRTVGPIVNSDGDGYLLVHKSVHVATGTCNSPITTVNQVGWSVLRLTRDGVVETVVVDETDALNPRQLLPDGVGGLLIRGSMAVGQTSEGRLIRYDAERVRTEYVISLATRVDLVGPNGIVYLQTRTGTDEYYGITEALDVTTFTTLWTKSPGWKLTAAKPGGGGTALDTNNQLIDIDSTGEQIGTNAFGLARPVQLSDMAVGQSTTAAEIIAVTFDSLDATRWKTGLERDGFSQYEPTAFGNDQLQLAMIIPPCEVPDLTVLANNEFKGVKANADYTYAFDMTSLWEALDANGDPVIDFPAVRPKILEGFRMWINANKASGVNATFTEVPFSQAKIQIRLKEDPSEDAQVATAASSFGGTMFASDHTIASINLHYYLVNAHSPDFFLKLTIHELGHGHGLRDSRPGTKPGRPAFGLYRTSVMNNHIGYEDAQGNMATFITPCDRKAAKDATARQYP